MAFSPKCFFAGANGRCRKPNGRRSPCFATCGQSAVIPALDARNIYDVPLQYHEAGLDDEVLRAFGINDAAQPDLGRWREIMDRIDHYESEVTIGVVGKYVGLPDAYKSLREALVHGGIANRAKVNIEWIDAEIFEHPEAEIAAELEPLHGILVPGGFGERGSEGKIACVKFARERGDSLLRDLPWHADGLHRGRAGTRPGLGKPRQPNLARHPSRWSE